MSELLKQIEHSSEPDQRLFALERLADLATSNVVGASVWRHAAAAGGLRLLMDIKSSSLEPEPLQSAAKRALQVCTSPSETCPV